MTKKNPLFLLLITIVVLGFIFPQNISMPVEGANRSSYHPQSFWFYPWGRSGTHKGVDIFAKQGKKIFSATPGLVVFCGEISMGGNVILILGPKWRFHYYAHLKEIKISTWSWINREEVIGIVGNTGNAIGKPLHLHYSIITPLPYVWFVDQDREGWKKMFYLNPISYFINSNL
ncbi:M23 family metallopeptidase [Leptospira interrogans]|uniref:M23 family metallopeptidase n=1 Tax=Leptospira interrogans TaxID=173 RepID=UPI0002BF0948|nr:M23 family metallopeptidase [Leptospira interrogans]EMN62230.1 peptidase, M23 family [Leptospira interrogans serovar Pyrogenes str. R168]ULG85772.1 M23 family metallopeptidase [Leptospira interrogans]ULG87372.1 M23 family metallopeptidase [Leptospira interrogans]